MPQSALLHIIQQYAIRTGNKCGLTAVALRDQSGLSMADVKKELNTLYVAGEIQVRDGAQGKLIFINNENLIPKSL